MESGFALPSWDCFQNDEIASYLDQDVSQRRYKRRGNSIEAVLETQDGHDEVKMNSRSPLTVFLPGRDRRKEGEEQTMRQFDDYPHDQMPHGLGDQGDQGDQRARSDELSTERNLAFGVPGATVSETTGLSGISMSCNIRPFDDIFKKHVVEVESVLGKGNCEQKPSGRSVGVDQAVNGPAHVKQTTPLNNSIYDERIGVTDNGGKVRSFSSSKPTESSKPFLQGVDSGKKPLILRDEFAFWESQREKLESAWIERSIGSEIRLNKQNSSSTDEILEGLNWLRNELRRYTAESGHSGYNEIINLSESANSIENDMQALSFQLPPVEIPQWKLATRFTTLPERFRGNASIYSIWHTLDELLHEMFLRDRHNHDVNREGLKAIYGSFRNAIKKREERHKEHLRATTSKLKNEIEELERKQKINEANSQDSISALQEKVWSLDEERKALIREIKTQREKADSQGLCIRDLETQLAGLKLQLHEEKKLTAELASNREIAMKRELDEQAAFYKRKLQGLRTDADLDRERFDQEKEGEINNLKKISERYRENVEERMKEIAKEHEDKLSKMSEVHDRQLEALSKEFHMQLEAAREANMILEQKLDSEKSEHATEISRLKGNYGSLARAFENTVKKNPIAVPCLSPKKKSVRLDWSKDSLNIAGLESGDPDS